MSKYHLVNCRYLEGRSNTLYTFATISPDLKKGDIVTSAGGGKMEVVEYTDRVPPQNLVPLTHRYTKEQLLVPNPNLLKQFQKEKHRDDEIAALRKQVAQLTEKLKGWEGYR